MPVNLFLMNGIARNVLRSFSRLNTLAAGILAFALHESSGQMSRLAVMAETFHIPIVAELVVSA